MFLSENAAASSHLRSLAPLPHSPLPPGDRFVEPGGGGGDGSGRRGRRGQGERVPLAVMKIERFFLFFFFFGMEKPRAPLRSSNERWKIKREILFTDFLYKRAGELRCPATSDHLSFAISVLMFRLLRIDGGEHIFVALRANSSAFHVSRNACVRSRGFEIKTSLCSLETRILV